ncbi:diguanylate cyclase domain-containing protein, partial [Candidatus Propionivibrio aalborgensis]|uniref:diguanylate cyclase domain-containing protein n=1 Tax=Candidatus Propionivibrio aalborgensis TaxID=1860101 RepID=UPI000A9BC02D
MLGYDDTVIGKLHVTDWDVQDSWEVISGRIEDMIVQRKKMVFETRHHRRDGSVLDVEISASGIEIEGKGYLYAASRDISERKRTEADLRIAATTFDSQEGIFITDANAGILRTNRAFEEITGYSSEEAVGQNPRLLSSGRHPPAFYTAMWESIVSAGTWRGEIWNRRKNGESYPQYLSITAVKKEDGTVTHYVASFTDITERKVAADKIEHLAFYDSLTDLPNRRLMLDRLRQAVANSARHNRHGALMLIDLDNFKTLNDTLGHAIGDQLLKEVALRLKASVREGDTVARLGGDEFVVILEDLDESDAAPRQAESVAEKILARLRYPYQLDLARADGSPGSRSHHCTLWVLETACRQLSIWAGMPETAHLTLAVNVSARQFRQPD